ncbi:MULTISPECIES: polysaccharide biosynthesis/export family protein [unclassified Luteibacter]|uniref:polysaccharide biosynthesis/export family protein n=1 Tax=unclassified Luteibacter TaxID=2620188 RepID=UPI0008CBF19C|nr:MULTISPECIES: polysaccharide biosynthesis/export family protein [unclassified Luteibacter]MDR6935634.1 polysaccharide export outer membrane protein [Luteibacter sp. 3190]SEO94851.1 polysaccharide export outer membrane protein [Luteibacter sp. UNC138MFCol5.1]SEV93246.1 polysaccharide export outer membrane protein [Luteibacter sp. 329MFSha]
MKFLPTLGLAGCCLLLQACILAPGQHMKRAELNDRESATGSRYQLVPITPKLIAMDRATASTPTVDPVLTSYRPDEYRIGPGDSLYITVWEHPELTSPAGSQQQTAANGRLVRPDGTLFYPYVGLLHAAGLSVEELRVAITDRLTKYIEKPQVDISVVNFASQKVTLGGAFVKTDPQDITVTPLTLAQAVGTAGINAQLADLSDVTLRRDNHEYHLDLDALSHSPQGTQDIYLKGGDSIYLPYNDRHEAYVIGEVLRPQAIAFKTSDLSLTQALGRAGGLNQTSASGKSVYVIRGVEDMEKAPATIYQLDNTSPSAFAVAAQFAVKPGDVVFVGPAGITRWNRFISQLLPLSGLISNAANAQYNLDRDRQL